MSPIPVPCQSLEQKLASLHGALEEAKSFFDAEGSPDAKQKAASRINSITNSIADTQVKLRQCIFDNTPPLAANFYGTATLQIDHPRTPDPMTTQISIPLNFSSNRATFTVGAALPVFSKSLLTPLGENITTITITVFNQSDAFMPSDPPSVPPEGWQNRAEWWTYVKPRGWMAASIDLTFRQSIDLGDWFDTQQKYPTFLRLSTDTVAAPSPPEGPHSSFFVKSPFSGAGVSMNEAGVVTLIGANQLRCEGVLAERQILVQVSGVVAPSPLLPP
jgi:hypothetical protein